jgi:hypothetical protein
VKPSIGAVVTLTNPFSKGYLAYLACIDSWSHIVDKMLIIDGGTTDESYTILKAWTNERTWSIFASPETRWVMDGLWHAGQWTINTTIGLQLMDTDWVFILNGDNVFKDESPNSLRSELSHFNDDYVISFRRTKLNNQGEESIASYSGSVLHMKKIRAEGLKIGFGVCSQTNMLSDYPIFLEQETSFTDPVNGCLKTLFKGKWFPIKNKSQATAMIYGHFFYNKSQLIKKIEEFSLIYETRYAKRGIITTRNICRDFGLHLKTGHTILPKSEELDKPHPLAIKRLIQQHYSSEMLGHNSGTRIKKSYFMSSLNRLSRMIKTSILYLRNFPSVEKKQTWHDNRAPSPNSALDLRSLYVAQDSFLPERLRIKHS